MHARTLVNNWNTALIAALLGFLLLYYLFALDQGFLLSLVQGNVAFDQNMIHEFLHDARHAAGIPCH